MAKTNVFDGTVVHVRGRMCSTCIFRPGNQMQLKPGRVEGLVADTERSGGVIPCHETIHGHRVQEAVCRGFFDLHPSPLLRLAVSMGVIQEDL